MKRIAVVGGGAAGLSAAWRLASSGVAVTLYERAPEVGGRMRSELIDGTVIDAGAQLFGSRFSALFRIAREVGAASLLVRAPGHDALYRKGHVHPITYGSVTSMITSTALPATLKLKLGARYVPFLLRHAHELDAEDPLAAGSERHDTESVAAWGEHALGTEFVELLAYPLLGAYYGSTPERTSAALYHALAREGLDVTVHAVRGGTGELMRAIANAIRMRGGVIRTNAEITNITVSDKSVSIRHGDATDTFSAAVLAVPAPQLESMIELDTRLREWMRGVEFSPSAVLAIVLKRPFQARFFGLSLLRRDPEVRDLVAVCVPSQKADGLVPAHRGLLICLSAPEQSAELLRDPERAVERMIAAVEHIFPGTRQDIRHVKLYRHAYGYPVFYPGYLRHLRAFPSDALPGPVQLAGDYLISPTVEGALRSGERAARRLMLQEREKA